MTRMPMVAAAIGAANLFFMAGVLAHGRGLEAWETVLFLIGTGAIFLFAAVDYAGRVARHLQREADDA